MEFEIKLKSDGPGVLVALGRVYLAKASGVLTIEWDKLKKQIIFRRGEPISVRSNIPDEAFAGFLLSQKLVDSATLKAQIPKKEKAGDKGSLTDWLIKEGILQAAMLPVLFQSHFQARLFTELTLATGTLNFKSLPEDHVFEGEIFSLSEPFPKILWAKIGELYSDKWLRGRLSAYQGKLPKISGEFPFPLKPQEFRLWNQLVATPKNPRELDAASLRLLVVANDMEMVTWVDASAIATKLEAPLNTAALVAEMKKLEIQFQKARDHEVLGVDAAASIEECQKKFYELVRKYHPDRLASDATPEQRKLSEKVFSKINSAFSTMTDPEKRLEYMAQIELDKAGGMEAIQRRVEAEFKIPNAQALLKRKQFKAALEIFIEIEKSLPDDGEIIADRVYSEFMVLAESKGDVSAKSKTFLADLKRALTFKSDYANAIFYRGMLAKIIGQLAQAQSDFETALEMDPKLTEAASELRLLNMRNNQKKK